MLTFMTPDPQLLLSAFDDAIAKGQITTWDKSNGYYGHKAERWAHKAFFKSIVKADRLIFEWIVVQNNNKPYESRSVYAYYHGHLIETFMNHFYYRYTNGLATPEPAEGDSLIK
jgi:hypothetical protein